MTIVGMNLPKPSNRLARLTRCCTRQAHAGRRPLSSCLTFLRTVEVPDRPTLNASIDNMSYHICNIVSPHLLQALAASEDPEQSRLASSTLQHTFHIHDRRKRCLEEASATRLPHHEDFTSQGIVPDQLLKQVIDSGNADSQSKELAQKTLDTKQQVPVSLEFSSNVPVEGSGPVFPREIYDMRNAEQKVGKSDETFKLLPGALVRSEGQAPVDDVIANQAYDNCAKVVEFYRQVLDYPFLGGSKAIISSIHFEKGYQNASWLGDSIQQMVYGDGGGNLYNFTACLDIIGHEMTVRLHRQLLDTQTQ